MIIYVINYLRGILKIKITGAYLERFFNVCAKNNIDLWNIKKICIDEIHCNILISDYKLLFTLMKNTKCSMEVLEHRGLLKFLKKFKKRYMFFVGILMSITVYFILTNYIWQIEIVGTEQTALMYEALEAENIGVGTKISNISPKELQNHILSKYDEFLWLSANIKGNLLTINVAKREETPEIIDKNSPCDIIAEKSGMIDNIDVLYGEKMIDVGQTFTGGDVLVSSEMKNYPQVENVETRYVHSIAEIRAKIWYDFESILLREMNEKLYTGNEKTRYTIIFSNFAINLFKNSGNPYQFYDKIVDTKEINLSSSVTVPIKIKSETYIEYEKVPALINPDFGIDLLSKNLYGDVLKNISGDVLEIITKENITNETIRINSNVTTLENIGIQIKR